MLILVCLAVGLWALGLIAGMIAAFPYGLPVLAVVAVVGYVVYRVIRERLENAEDDYYEKNVDK
jgi:hypothetical protein